jgi:hypothetical protein
MHHITYETAQYLHKYTHVQEEEGRIVSEYNILFYI